MDLKAYLRKQFPDGLTYNETVQLCLYLYSNASCLPEALHSQCTKENIASVFTGLAKENFITTEPLEAALYGSNFHQLTSHGHWVEVIASIFKSKNTIDTSLSKILISCLTGISTK